MPEKALPPPVRIRSSRLLWLPYALISLALIFSLLLIFYTWQAFNARDETRFANRTRLISNSILHRFETYLLALRGGTGIVDAYRGFDRKAFHAYAQSLELQKHYPGILGLGFSQRVGPEEINGFTAAMRAESGNAGFRIWPDEPRNDYHAIIYLYPLDVRNQAAIGYDMSTDETRREAMARAAATGEPAASGVVTLVQEIGENKQPGFLIYLPVYEGGGTPASEEERLRLLDGFVYAPFRLHDLFEGLFPDEAFSYIHFQVFDGGAADPEKMFYRTAQSARPSDPALARTIHLPVAGRTWTVRFWAEEKERNFLPWFAATEVFLFASLLFVTFLLSRTQERLRRKAQRLKEAEERVRLVVESDPNGIFVLNRNGGILMANRQAGKLFDGAKESLAGTSVFSLFRRDRQPLVRETLAGAVLHRSTRRAEVCAQADGKEIPVEIFISPMDAEAQLLVAAVVDISERKKHEEEIRNKNERLEHSNQELERFAYIASHDLQEPLRTVSSFTELLGIQYANRLDREGKNYLQYIQDGAVMAQRLIQELLEYARIGTEGASIEKIDLGAIVEKILAGLRTAITESGAEIRVAPLPEVTGDRSRITQLLQNLLQNALKYRDPGRKLCIDVSAEETEDEWIVSVKDTGIGIAPEYHEKIFRIFQRLHTKAEYPGTGIGLAVCMRIVEQHGGRIWLESEEGKGSAFYVSLSRHLARERFSASNSGTALEEPQGRPDRL